jgi:hypothetical protein
LLLVFAGDGSPGEVRPRQTVLTLPAGSQQEANRVNFTYYDHAAGRQRVKRRYTWASWAFGIGLVLGIVAAKMM